jgi:hypothetical protein
MALEEARVKVRGDLKEVSEPRVWTYAMAQTIQPGGRSE